jgi:hypothetical protein
VRGFEPPASSSRTKRATGLRYTPNGGSGIGFAFAYQRTIHGGLGWHIDVGYMNFISTEYSWEVRDRTRKFKSSVSIIPIRAGLLYRFSNDNMLNFYLGLLTGGYVTTFNDEGGAKGFIPEDSETFYGFSPQFGVLIPLDEAHRNNLGIGISYDIFFGLVDQNYEEYMPGSLKISASWNFDFDVDLKITRKD